MRIGCVVVGLLLCSGPVMAQDKAAQAKETLAALQAAEQGARRDMLATKEGQRYQEVAKALQAFQALIAEPKPPVATKIEPKAGADKK